jgi:hypothetical protein
MTELLGNNETDAQDQTATASSQDGARGAAGAKSGLGSRKDRKSPIHQHVSRRLAGRDLRTTAQPASSPEGRWKEFGERRRAKARSPEWDGTGWDGMGMQDGSVVKRREGKPALSEAFLPWSRGQLSEAGKGPVVVNRGKSMRRRLLLVGEKWR